MNTNLPRTFTRSDWTRYFRIERKMLREPTEDESVLAERVKIQSIIDKYTEDDRIGLVESGMDCDCVQYCHGSEYPAMRAIQFQRQRDDMYEWADGPCNLSICRPSELPQNYSRDLALEAFEDGHPHIVYA